MLTDWSRVTHLYVDESIDNISHYLNQGWLFVELNQNAPIQVNAYENAVCKMSPFSTRPRHEERVCTVGRAAE